MREMMTKKMMIESTSPEKWAEYIDIGYAVSEQCLDHFIAAYIDEPDEGEVLLNGPIVGEGTRAWLAELGMPSVSPESFTKSLKAAGRQPKIRINSPGGSVYSASAIMTRMNEAKADNITMHALVEGVAASAASLVAITADMSTISELGAVYVHRPMAMMFGSYYDEQLLDEAATLADMGEVIAGIYDRKGLDYKAIGHEDAMGLMKGRTGDGTWLTAKQSVASRMIGGVLIGDEDARSDNIDKEEKDLQARMRMHQFLRAKENSS